MFVDKKKIGMTHVYIYTHCYHSACTSHPHHSNTPGRMYQTIHDHTRTPLNEHTHHQLQKPKRLSTSLCHCIHTAHSFVFTTHTIIFLIFFVKTMMWQASCCLFGGLLIISRLSDQQTRVVTFRAGFLCIGIKDRVWWHLTKQPVRPVDVIKTKSIISYVLVPNWCVKKKLCIVSQSHLFLLSWYISK